MRVSVIYDPDAHLVGLEFECSDPAEAEQLFARLKRQIGGGRIEIGIADSSGAPPQLVTLQ